PPLGVNLFVASGIAKIPLEPIIKKAIPLLGANLAALFLITNIESISMFLVRLFGV
ncbi:MAG: TRAP transporter large permease subunit, partial [Peptococcales bacterium]